MSQPESRTPQQTLQDIETLKKQCEGALFHDCRTRDYLIMVLAAAIVLILAWLYMNYDKIIRTEKLDNRPRWNMGGLRDDTGASNNPTVFNKGYGLDMTSHGAKTLQKGFDVALGKATYTADGHTQSEYTNWAGMEHENTANSVKKEPYSQKKPERFENSPKTRDDQLRKMLIQ